METLEKKIKKPRVEKVPPKWMEDLAIMKATCSACKKLYIADRMLERGGRIVFPSGKTYHGSNEFYFYCNETCLKNGIENNKNRIPK